METIQNCQKSEHESKDDESLVTNIDKKTQSSQQLKIFRREIQNPIHGKSKFNYE